ncbi:Druantia anti-phage system protein DruA [Chloroflexota bacterium]
MTTEISSDKWDTLRRRLLQALNGSNGSSQAKDAIRIAHEPQRRERAKSQELMLRSNGQKLVSYFAEGHEIIPSKVRPQLVHIENADSFEARLFRAATLFWSVPVSSGYGRRLRFLVMDRQNSKLIGILAIGDPVFNLACRDQWIGWDVNQRRERLAYMLDAYILGSVPPYSMLLGGKVVGSLLNSHEIKTIFRKKYAGKQGIISGHQKDPYLALLTTTSALGKSSIYNRLKLPGMVEFLKIGRTSGWGHFMISDDLFREVRLLLKEQDHSYHNGYKFGQGPSWRLRTIRKACELLDIDKNLLQHGIQREVYAVPLASNWREILHGEKRRPKGSSYTASQIGKSAVERWVIPRSERKSDWRSWQREDSWKAITQYAFDSIEDEWQTILSPDK